MEDHCMLFDVEQMAKTAECPCCHKHGDFSVMLNFSFRDKECTVTCRCNHCHSVHEVESSAIYEMVNPVFTDAA